MSQTASIVLAAPPSPGLQESTKNSTIAWQQHLEELFRLAKDRFPDVVWELLGDEDDPIQVGEEVWGHKAIVYARAPPSFQSRYFSFRSNGATSPLPYSSSPSGGHYPAESALSLPEHTSLAHRTPSPFRTSSPSTTLAAPSMAPPTLLRLTTSINPTLFSNELEYLYTGKGFGEAFEFLFEEHANGGGDDAEELRIDKLRKDLVFMWRSRLYSDVRISLTGNFGGSHENTTAIFSAHRFMLVSRSSYFHDALLSWPSNKSTPSGEPPTLTLPSPPFTPASLHFTLGFIYTGTLIFSHRSYDLSTGFAILRAALFLDLSTLHDEIQARIAQEMMHGLFHAFIEFAEYERLTGGRWGTGGCRCRQCARRAPRVLEFALADDVKNQLLERGARRALVGLFGEGWCNQEFASLPQKIRESILRGLGKRTTPLNAFPLLFASEHALEKLANSIEPWTDTVREMIFSARKGVDEVLAKEAEACFNSEEWMEMMESDGVRFEDGERVEWVMAAVLRGVKESFAPLLYQTIVSSILLRPHPTEVNAPHLPATSHIRIQVEETRLELLKWIAKRWLAVRQERGFDPLEGWAIKEISDYIEVPLDDLLNPPAYSSPKSNTKRAQSAHLLRPMSNHPHTSKVDAESDVASSMRVSLLSRNMRSEHTSSSLREDHRTGSGSRTVLSSSAGSVRSVARSTRSTSSAASGATTSTVSAAPRRRANVDVHAGAGMSPARRLATEVRAGMALKDRPDSKLTPSIIEPQRDRDRDSVLDDADSGYGYQDEDGDRDDIYNDDYDGESQLDGQSQFDGQSRLDGGEEEEEEERFDDEESREAEEGVSTNGDEDGNDVFEDTKESLGSGSVRSSLAESMHSQKPPQSPSGASTPKKVLITRSSLASVKSRVSISPGGPVLHAPRLKSSSASIKSFSSVRTTSSIRSPPSIAASVSPRPISRGSTRSSRLNVSVTGSGARAKPISRPVSRLSASSTTLPGTGSSRPSSGVSTTTDSTNTYRTASTGLNTPTTRSRRTSAASVRTAGPRSSQGASPVQERARRISGASVSSVASTAASIRSTATGTPRTKKASSPASPIDPSKLSPAAARAAARPGSIKAAGSAGSGSSTTSAGKKPVPVGTLGRKPISKAKSTESLTPSLAPKSPGASPASTTTKLEDAPEPPTTTNEAVSTIVRSDSEKENILPSSVKVPEDQSQAGNTSSTMTIKPKTLPDVLVGNLEHKKTVSSASTSSVATVKRRGSSDTIKTAKSSVPAAVAAISRPISKALPQPPVDEPQSAKIQPQTQPQPQPPSHPTSIDQVLADYVPRGSTLEIGIPCIISSKRKRFKAYARYIGEVEGETGPWVGVEVPMPVGDSWGDRELELENLSKPADGRQWNDGSWCGIRYFEISSMGSGSEMDYGGGEDRAARRRRIDAGSVGGAMWGSKGVLKREGDQLSISSDRMKRMRSVSPAISDMSGTESRGLFVRPQQVLYVVDAVGSDL